MGTHTVLKWGRYFALSAGCRGAPRAGSCLRFLVPGFLPRKLRASPLMRGSVAAEGSDVLVFFLLWAGGVELRRT